MRRYLDPEHNSAGGRTETSTSDRAGSAERGASSGISSTSGGSSTSGDSSAAVKPTSAPQSQVIEPSREREAETGDAAVSRADTGNADTGNADTGNADTGNADVRGAGTGDAASGEGSSRYPAGSARGGKPAPTGVTSNVRKIRIERMMSKAELARRANLSVLTVDRVEKGYGCRMDTKRKILEALGLSLADRVQVFGEEE